MDFKEFDEKVNMLNTYLKWLEQNFVLHDIEDAQKVPAILSWMKSKLYGSLYEPRHCKC